MASHIDVIYETLQPLEQEFQAVCSEPTIAFKREIEFAMQVFSGNEYLAKVAAGNPLSTRSDSLRFISAGNLHLKWQLKVGVFVFTNPSN